MGWLSWIFPTDEDRIARAKRLMEREKYADARMEVMGLTHPDAQQLVASAEEALSLKNLEIAVSWCQAGDDVRARHHLEIAQNFHGGGLDEAFKEARRQMREIRQQHRLEEEHKKAERDARMAALEDSPFHAKSDLKVLYSTSWHPTRRMPS